MSNTDKIIEPVCWECDPAGPTCNRCVTLLDQQAKIENDKVTLEALQVERANYLAWLDEIRDLVAKPEERAVEAVRRLRVEHQKALADIEIEQMRSAHLDEMLRKAQALIERAYDALAVCPGADDPLDIAAAVVRRERDEATGLVKRQAQELHALRAELEEARHASGSSLEQRVRAFGWMVGRRLAAWVGKR